MIMQNCPECGSNHLRWSKRRGVRERVAAWVVGRPVRCRECRHRFFLGRDLAFPRWGTTAAVGFLEHLNILESRQ
jgi:hypothetical protein